MQKLATFSLVLVLALMTLSAEEGKKEKKAKKAKPALEEISLVGTLTKNEQPEAEEGKKAKKVAPFTLTLEDGTAVAIQEAALKKNSIDLEPLVDKKITLAFSGMKQTKKDKTMYMVKIVTSAAEATEEAAE